MKKMSKEEKLDLIVEKCKNNYRLVSKEAFYELYDQDISLIYKGENNLYFYQDDESDYYNVYEISNIKFKEDFIELEFKTEIGKLCKELYLIKLLKLNDIIE